LCVLQSKMYFLTKHRLLHIGRVCYSIGLIGSGFSRASLLGSPAHCSGCKAGFAGSVTQACLQCPNRPPIVLQESEPFNRENFGYPGTVVEKAIGSILERTKLTCLQRLVLNNHDIERLKGTFREPLQRRTGNQWPTSISAGPAQTAASIIFTLRSRLCLSRWRPLLASICST
jgi:hypothetical protein